MPLLPPRHRAALLLAATMLGLFTVHAGTATATGSEAPAASGGTLLIVGDSLTEGATILGGLKTLTVAKGPWKKVVIDYKRGRRITDALPVVRRRLSSDRSVTAVVLALGTNDMLSRGEPWYPASVIDRMMAETLGLPVLWVNLAFDGRIRPVQRARATVFNRELLAATTGWSTLRVADWRKSFVPRGRSRFIADGIHLTTSGYRTRASWTSTQIARFGMWTSDRTSTTTSTTPTTTTMSVTSTTPATSTTAGSTLPGTTVPAGS
ncbi:MAG: SGNH/GDSL hydrolase family protein [Acidimicrobiales bacterium]